MIDLHSHVLHGLDDGARSLEESVEIARAAVADGIEVLAATPHVREDYPTTPEEMEAAADEVRAELERAGVPLDLRTGGEVALDALDDLGPDALRRFGLGGNPSYLLVECPYYGWPLDLPDRLFRLRLAGITPVFAHPERNGEVQADPDRLEGLVESGTLVQVTAASLDGRLGRSSREAGLRLVERGLAQLIASDAHHPGVRAIGMSAAVEAVGDEELAAWLTSAVPRAILDDGPLPPRPEGKPRRRGWFGLGR
ncbi:MAG: tyrosine protein phosphatase [Actinobacteria bacterium]|nr:tyrosine protein phosphatase [Actinomycetota bacterium]